MSNINDAYELCHFLLSSPDIYGAVNIGRMLGWTQSKTESVLNTVRQGKCPPYRIPYNTPGTWGRFTVIDTTKMEIISPDQLLEVGEKAWILMHETMTGRQIAHLALIAEREPNPAKKEADKQIVTLLKLVMKVLEERREMG